MIRKHQHIPFDELLAELLWRSESRNSDEIFERLNFVNDTMRMLVQKMEKLMSQVTDFAAKVQTSLDKLSTDLDSVTTEIAALNTSIQTLQNSQGVLGPSDQAALDDIAAKSAALASKADALVVPPLPPTP